jgi:hypothetical protein
MPMKLVKIIATVLLLLFVVLAHSQAQIRVTGQIVDRETGESLPGASIYIPSTSIGVSSNNNGFFDLSTSLPSPFQVNISFMGYNTVAIQIDESKLDVKIELDQKTLMMKEVEVEATKEYHWRDFIESFLGRSSFSRACKIENPEDVIIYFDKDINRLEAYAQKPIIIKNEALGYRISYWLELFVYDYETNISTVLGYPQFEDLILKKPWPWTSKKWERNRKSSYLGSMNHFVKSVYHGTSKQEGYQIGIMNRVPVGETYKSSEKTIDTLTFSNKLLARVYQKANQVSSFNGSVFSEALVQKVKKWFFDETQPDFIRLKIPIQTDSGMIREAIELKKSNDFPSKVIYSNYILNAELEKKANREFVNVITKSDAAIEDFIERKDKTAVFMNFPNYLYITYKKESEEKDYQLIYYGNYDSNRKEQVSVLSIPSKIAIRILEDGNFNPADAFLVEGYWVYEKLDKMLPLDYTFNK